MAAPKESSKPKLQLLQQHVNDLSDQKNKVSGTKSELLQKKDIAMSDVSDKCESLKKSINRSKTSAIRQLNEFYEKQEKLLNEVLANLETRIAKAEEELIIDLNGIPVPTVEAMSYDFDVTKAKTSIDQIELRSSMNVPSPSGETKRSTSEGSEKEKEIIVEILARKQTKSISAPKNLPKQPYVPTLKKPRLCEGQRREHVRDCIKCYKCNKPRCIYRDYFLIDEEKMELSKLKASASYVCGRQLPTTKYNVAKTLVVEDEIDCASFVSWHYFQPKLRNPPVCYMCGSNSISPMSEEEKQEYRTLHKICTPCQLKGRKPRCVKKARVEYSDDESMEDCDSKSYFGIQCSP